MPPVHHARHFGGEEREERLGLGEPIAGRCVRPDRVDATRQARDIPPEYAVLAQRNAVPHVAVDPVHVATGTRLALATRERELLEVPDGAADRGRARIQDLTQLGGGTATG